MPVFIIDVTAIGKGEDAGVSTTQTMIVRAARREGAVAIASTHCMQVRVATEDDLVEAGRKGHGPIIETAIAMAGS